MTIRVLRHRYTKRMLMQCGSRCMSVGVHWVSLNKATPPTILFGECNCPLGLQGRVACFLPRHDGTCVGFFRLKDNLSPSPCQRGEIDGTNNHWLPRMRPFRIEKDQHRPTKGVGRNVGQGCKCQVARQSLRPQKAREPAITT